MPIPVLHLRAHCSCEAGVSSLGALICTEQGCRAAVPDSAFSLWMSIPNRHARLDRGAHFSKDRESENFLKLSPKPACTTQLCLVLLFCNLEIDILVQLAPMSEDCNIPTAAL